MIDDIATPDAGHRRRMEAGELSEAIAAFASDLAELGHAALTIAAYECSARHLGAWMALSGVDVRDLDDGVFQRFARHRCRCGGSRGRDRLSTKYINRARRFAYFLGERGLAPRILVQPEPVTFPPLVTAFVNWLRCHRGLSERTISRHARMISQLLPALGADPGAYDAACVRTVILDEGCRCSAAHVKTMAMALRGYLRFLAARVRIPEDPATCSDNIRPPVPEYPATCDALP